MGQQVCWIGRIVFSDGLFLGPIDGVVLGSLFELDVGAHKSFPILGMMSYVGDDFGLPWGYFGLSPLPE